VVKFAIWSEIFMDLLPAYVSYFTTLIAGISLSSYYGDMLDTLTSLEAAFCALYYWWIFQARI
jgi:hypothetical protein